MIAIKFPEVTQMIAEDQPDFMTLPSYVNQKTGLMVNCFSLEPHEIESIVMYKKIWIHHFLPSNGHVQPFNMVAVNDYFSSVIHDGKRFIVSDSEEQRDLDVENDINSEGITTPFQELFVHMIKKHKLTLSDDDLQLIINLSKEI